MLNNSYYYTLMVVVHKEMFFSVRAMQATVHIVVLTIILQYVAKLQPLLY